MPHIKGHSGINWFYEIHGEGEPIVFLHGWGVDRRIWRQQTKHFSEMYKVIGFDLPGHGESSWKKVTLDEMGSDLLKIIKHMKLKEFTLVGSSLGGLFALKLYELISRDNTEIKVKKNGGWFLNFFQAKATEASHLKINRLVLVGSMPKFARSEDYPYGLDVAQMKKLGGQLDTSYPSIVNIFFRSLFTDEERASRRFKWLQKFRQTDEVPMKQALSEYLDVLEQSDLREVLKNCGVPMQYINGTEDAICTRATVEYLRSLSPHARFDDFERCGHFPFLSKPHEFNQILEDFLNQEK